MKADATICIISVHAPHAGLAPVYSSTLCMPTCSHQGHLSTGIPGSVAQWLEPAVLSGGWEKHFIFF